MRKGSGVLATFRLSLLPRATNSTAITVDITLGDAGFCGEVMGGGLLIGGGWMVVTSAE